MRTNQIVAKTLVCVAVAGWLGMMSHMAQANGIAFCGEEKTSILKAGQHINAGSVEVLNDEDTLCVLVMADAPWLIAEYHVSIVSAIADFPTNKPGNPQLGQFEFKSSNDPWFDPYSTSFFVCVDLAERGFEAGDEIYIAVHVVVVQLDIDGSILASQTAWGDGERFVSKGSWAMYMTYEIQECKDEPPIDEPDGFRTQTQGGWGQKKVDGNNPGSYRHKYFGDAFPTGVVIGCQCAEFEGYWASFTSSDAVMNFLPQGGPSRKFSKNWTDPVKAEKLGNLAGQVLTLSLNVGFDWWDDDFGANQDYKLAELVIDEAVNSFYVDKTVGWVLEYANAVLGGCVPFDPSINPVVTAINEYFVPSDSEDEEGDEDDEADAVLRLSYP